MGFRPLPAGAGDVRAKNFATAGSEVLIEGNLEVTQTVAGIYNHGHTVIKGDTRAEVVLTDEHLTEFQGALSAALGIAGNFLRVGDPENVRVNGWAGYVCDLQGRILPDLGSRSTRALRALDPDFWDLDSRTILKAIEAGRSLLRAPGPAQTDPDAPGTPADPADAIRHVLRQAGCREHDRWEDGFIVGSGKDDQPDQPFEVYFCEADEPDEPGTDGAPEPLDPVAELSRYAEALAVARYQVAVDPHDEDVLQVRHVGRNRNTNKQTT